MSARKRFLVKHVGNMGDFVFFVPPTIATLKRRYPDCHITVVAAWGFKEVRRWPWRRELWGRRNQGGFCLHLMMHDPHVDQLVQWHDQVLALDASYCFEDGRWLPTWSRTYYEAQRSSGTYDGVYELDFGLTSSDNPMAMIYERLGLPEEDYSNYQLYLSPSDRAVGEAVMAALPHPRIVLLESIEGTTTRGWDPAKVAQLERQVTATYGVPPIWFGGRHVPEFEGRSLTLRENIATLLFADIGIGVLSGPLHFAAAVGLPTLTLYGDHAIHRAAPAYFLNRYIADPRRRHRTLLAPSPQPMTLLKSETPPACLTPSELARQNYRSWLQPGRQATKACLAPLTVDEVMTVLADMVTPA